MAESYLQQQPVSPPPTLEKLHRLTNADMSNVNEVIIASINQHVPLITDITHHIIKSGGKRLRPTLTLACASLLNYQGNRHIELAAAVELIHTATLLHDDVVDESTMRRGIETANTIWSNQASVLVGDFLLSRAFQLMVSSGSLDVLKLLSDASATISQGEVKQLMVAGDLDTGVDIYLDIITSKTATLFSAACEIAPIINEQSSLRSTFSEFGLALGIAFQLVDDALDYASSQAILGKAIGDDLREGKITLPVMVAYQQANEQERNFWQRVITEGNCHEADVAYAIRLIESHGGIAETFALAKTYADKAHKLLHQIKGQQDATDALRECIDFCIGRMV